METTKYFYIINNISPTFLLKNHGCFDGITQMLVSNFYRFIDAVIHLSFTKCDSKCI